MPIKDVFFGNSIYNGYYVILPIGLINPKTNTERRTYGIIDTGATDTAIPAELASLLGHNLKQGEPIIIKTGNGDTIGYRHTFTINIYHPESKEEKIVHSIENVVIDCMPNLTDVLLGVKTFLSGFQICIDYPNSIFSLIKR